MTDTDLPLSPEAWEARAREVLPSETYDYYAGGAGDEVTLRANRDAWGELFLRPRVLVDVGEVDTSVRLLGELLPHPVVLAPTAFQRLAHDEGELATARAAGATGSLLVASSLSTVTIEAIGAAATGPLWLQLYVFRDREISADLVRRGREAGCRALCLTVSVPVQGNRERDANNSFHLPDGLEMANFSGHVQAHMPEPGGSSGLDRFIGEQFDPSLTWDAVGWLLETAGVPVVLKGSLAAKTRWSTVRPQWSYPTMVAASWMERGPRSELFARSWRGWRVVSLFWWTAGSAGVPTCSVPWRSEPRRFRSADPICGGSRSPGSAAWSAWWSCSCLT